MVLNFDLRSLKIGYFYATYFCQVKKKTCLLLQLLILYSFLRIMNVILLPKLF